MNNYKVIGVTTKGKRTQATLKAESYDVALMKASQMVTEISTLKFTIIPKQPIQ